MDDMLAGDDYVDEDEDEDEDTDFEKVGLKLPTHTIQIQNFCTMFCLVHSDFVSFISITSPYVTIF